MAYGPRLRFGEVFLIGVIGLGLIGGSILRGVAARGAGAGSVGGAGKKFQKNGYHYEFILPSIGVYTASRTDSNPFWLWQADSGTWFAGPELSLPLDSATQEFDNQLVDVQWMCKGQVTQPGVHNWFQWVENREDWAREPCQFVPQLAEEFPVDRTLLPPGVTPRHGWYDPNRPVVDDSRNGRSSAG